jgi:hypothetical protein
MKLGFLRTILNAVSGNGKGGKDADALTTVEPIVAAVPVVRESAGDATTGVAVESAAPSKPRWKGPRKDRAERRTAQSQVRESRQAARRSRRAARKANKR